MSATPPPLIGAIKEHGSKVIAICALGCLVGYTALRSWIYKQQEQQQQEQSSLLSDNRPTNVIRICLTGGPCGGKTTAMNTLYQSLSDSHVSTFIVPQAATLIADSGGMLNTNIYSPDELIEFQFNLLKAQVVLENAFLEIAVNDEKKQGRKRVMVVLCDRGLMDGKAYMENSLWERMLRTYKIKERNMRDTRYDAVFHLVTAADGAAKFYTTANSTSRRETPQQAIELDGNTRQSWFGHPNLIVIDNGSVKNFNQKVDKVVNKVLTMIQQRKAQLGLE